MGATVIEVTELYKYYGAKRALGPITFSVEPGEIVGLLGLNGAGKTTTLRILACDLLPTSGSVRVAGVDLATDQDEVRAKIGYLPDTPPLYGEMTVREYLLFAARLRGLAGKPARTRVEEVCELTEVGALAEEPIASLSHGFKQRVGIAQAIVHKPALVLLDEPISGLDPVQIVEMRRLVRNLRGEHTVVISSHILTEISETCDTLLVLRDGEIVAVGSERSLSEQLVRGRHVELSVRLPGERSESEVRDLLGAVGGVQAVEVLPATEPGAAVSSFRIVAVSDVREQLVKAVVEAGCGLLELRLRERELESIFIELAGARPASARIPEKPDGSSRPSNEPDPDHVSETGP